MDEIGRRMVIEVQTGAGDQCGVDVERWDSPTTPGLGSQDEMCAVGILLTEDP